MSPKQLEKHEGTLIVGCCSGCPPLKRTSLISRPMPWDPTTSDHGDYTIVILSTTVYVNFRGMIVERNSEVKTGQDGANSLAW